MIRLSMSDLRQQLKLIVFLFMMSLLQPMAAQDLDARSPKPMPLGREQKKADKKKAKQAAELDKAIRKGRKQHEKLQSKQTKKMMKKELYEQSLTRKFLSPSQIMPAISLQN